MDMFERQFRHLGPELLQDLQTLEVEGALYSQFWREDVQDFRFCRIRLRPAEIVAYVDAATAYDEFLGHFANLGDPAAALEAVSSPVIRRRVHDYNEWTQSIDQLDTLYCFAAFLGDDLKNLTCGGRTDRYEYISETYTGDRRFLLTEILEMFPSCAAYLQARSAGRPCYPLDEEQDVRDLLYALIKSVFPDARVEEFTPLHAGGSKKIDIVVPAIGTVIEAKFVRDAQHAKRVADELKIDFESYHAHPKCARLIAYVWDPARLLVDRANFINDLRGLRVKGDSRFTVDVFVKP